MAEYWQLRAAIAAVQQVCTRSQKRTNAIGPESVRCGWVADVEGNGELMHHVSMSRFRRFLALLWNPAKDRPQSAWMVNLAVALILTPPVILLPNTINFFLRPLWMFGSWSDFGFFAGFYALPWTVAGMLLHAVTAAEGETGRSKGDL